MAPDRFVAVIVGLAPREDGRLACLLDVIPGRSKKVLKTWLQAQSVRFRLNVKTVAMDGFTDYKNAVREVLSSAVTVMDPFHVAQLVDDKITACPRHLQQETTGRRGRKGDLLCQTRRLLLTRNRLLEGTAATKVDQVLTDPKYAGRARIWSITAYENPNKRQDSAKLASVIDALDTEVTKGIPELRSLARTLRRHRTDILSFFTHPYSSNGQLSHQPQTRTPARHRPGI